MQWLHLQDARLIACAYRGKAITGSAGREERQGEWRNSVGFCSGCICSECENRVEIVDRVVGGELLKIYLTENKFRTKMG